MISKLLEGLGTERAIRGISSPRRHLATNSLFLGPSLGTGRFRKRSEMMFASGRRTFEPRGCNSKEYPTHHIDLILTNQQMPFI
ncbi:hypothetical protein M0802_000831 [Mischocyttarus mexicanus]|nr:hypothetical protein M0802_000831 [Mischocyttarus mexicanus]